MMAEDVLAKKEEHLARIEKAFGAFELDNEPWDRLMALGYVGSLSHGTHGTVIDDVDFMGIVVPPPKHIVGLGQWTHWVYQKDELDVVLYSVKKMMSLLLKQNPNVLGFLWLQPEHYLKRSMFFNELVRNRDAFVSKKAYHSFAGYAHDQLTRLQQGAYRGYMGEQRKRLVEEFGYDPKNAAHLVRLLRMAIEFLDTGEFNVYREDREELKLIKAGKYTLQEIQEMADDLFEQAEQAHERSSLPEEPDYERAENLLMKIQSAQFAAWM